MSSKLFRTETNGNVPYALVMGGLVYAQTCIRPDISFDADMFGKY